MIFFGVLNKIDSKGSEVILFHTQKMSPFFSNIFLLNKFKCLDKDFLPGCLDIDLKTAGSDWLKSLLVSPRVTVREKIEGQLINHS